TSSSIFFFYRYPTHQHLHSFPTRRSSDLNLELIDIDSKYYEGISIKLFKEIKSLRPDLYDKLRVHKTPSGGYHILYRIADGEPRSEEHTSELQSRENLVCRLLLEKKKKIE